MTKLESELLQAIEKAHFDFGNAVGGNEDHFMAQHAAGATIKWLRQAFEDGQLSVNTQHGEFEETFEEWANENGVI